MSIHWEGARRNSATLKKDVAAEARSTCLESCVERRSRSSYVVQAARLKKKAPDAKKGQDLGGMTISASCDFFLLIRSGVGMEWQFLFRLEGWHQSAGWGPGSKTLHEVL